MKLLQNRLKQADYVRTVHAAQPEPGTTLEQMLAPEYWAHVAKQLKAGDRIEVTSADNEWHAELFVRATTDTGAQVFLMATYVFAVPAAADEDFEVKARGGAGWSVIRKSDKAVLFEKGTTRAEAEKFLADMKAKNLG